MILNLSKTFDSVQRGALEEKLVKACHGRVSGVVWV